MRTLIGFFESDSGVRSMTRLTVFRLTTAAEFLVAAIIYVAVKKPDAGVIAALGSVLLGLCGGIWAALREKRKGDEGAPDPAAPAAVPT